jgi:hypothetical protein
VPIDDVLQLLADAKETFRRSEQIPFSANLESLFETSFENRLVVEKAASGASESAIPLLKENKRMLWSFVK